MRLNEQTLPMPQVSNFFFPFNPSLEEEMKRLFINFPLETSPPFKTTNDVMEEFRHNGRDYEYCPETENVKPPQPSTRRKKNKKPLPSECVFCRNNGEHENYYRQHILKGADGRIICPVLRAYICPICGANGDLAHTRKYCPKNPGFSSTVQTLRLLRNSVGRVRK